MLTLIIQSVTQNNHIYTYKLMAHIEVKGQNCLGNMQHLHSLGLTILPFQQHISSTIYITYDSWF